MERNAFMKWEEAADALIKRMPVDSRRKVKSRAEAAALKAGKNIVTMADVEDFCKASTGSVSHESIGFRLDACSGNGVCSNRAHGTGNDTINQLFEKIRDLLEKEDLGDFLKKPVNGPLRPHHVFRVSLSDCPNACSQPQIKDIGILAAAVPMLTEKACILCGSCENACRESAVCVDTEREIPVIDKERCISCGSCITVCPTGAIAAEVCGYRVMIGGKLGRHPRLANELQGIHDVETVLFIIKWCVDVYRVKSRRGKRFAEIVAQEKKSILSNLEQALQKNNTKKRR